MITVTITMMLCINLAIAAPFRTEDSELRRGMENALNAGLETFGGRIKKPAPPPTPVEQPKDKPIVYSLYTKDIESPSGGKPALAEQYIHNHYTPLAPSVLPVELPPSTGRETAAEAAQRYVPRPPLQYTEDRLRV